MVMSGPAPRVGHAGDYWGLDLNATVAEVADRGRHWRLHAVPVSD